MKNSAITEYIETLKNKHPEWAGNIKGASHDEIKELEDILGKKLPSEYRVFLETMGRETGGLFAVTNKAHAKGGGFNEYPLKYDFNISSIIKLSRKIRRKLKKNPKLAKKLFYNTGLIPIALQYHSQDGGYYYLDCRAENTAPVVNVDAYGDLRAISPSLADFLKEYAFRPEKVF